MQVNQFYSFHFGSKYQNQLSISFQRQMHKILFKIWYIRVSFKITVFATVVLAWLVINLCGTIPRATSSLTGDNDWANNACSFSSLYALSCIACEAEKKTFHWNRSGIQISCCCRNKSFSSSDIHEHTTHHTLVHRFLFSWYINI